MRLTGRIAIGSALAALLLCGVLRQAGPFSVFPAFADAAETTVSPQPSSWEAPDQTAPVAYPNTRDLLPTPTPVPTAPAPTPFSIVWIGDTQTMVYQRLQQPALPRMGQWIRDNTGKENIVQVLHTGDLVENGFNPRYWQSFYEFYDRIGERTPFFAVAGNHDIGRGRDDYAAYLGQPFLERLSPEQKLDGGISAWMTLSAGGETFLLLGAGYGREEVSIEFFKSAIRTHPDAIAVLLMHSYMSPRGVITKEGKKLRDSIVSAFPEVRLVLCGHTYGTALRTESFDLPGGGTRTVYAMLQNFQKWEEGGQMRLLTFDPADRSITVTTFSPFTGRLYKDGTTKKNVFVLEHAF